MSQATDTFKSRIFHDLDFGKPGEKGRCSGGSHAGFCEVLAWREAAATSNDLPSHFIHLCRPDAVTPIAFHVATMIR